MESITTESKVIDLVLLKRLLSIATKLTKKSILPITDLIYIKNGDGWITNLDNHMRIPGIFPEGKIVVSLQSLLDALAGIKEKEAYIYIEETNLIIQTAKNIYKFGKEHESDEFPVCPRPLHQNPHVSINMSESDRKSILKAIEFCGNDELRPVMSHVVLGEQIVATNAHILFWENSSNEYYNKLGFYTVDRNEKLVFNNQELVSKMTIEVIKSQKDLPIIVVPILEYNKDVDYSAEERMTEYCFSDFSWYQRRLLEIYPQYKAVIPTEFSTNVLIGKKEVIEMLDAGKWIWKKLTTARTIWNFHENIVEMTSEDVDYNREFYTKENCSIKGEPLTIGFNGNFMEKCLSLQDEDPIILKFSGEKRACCINDNMLITPLMLKE